LRTGEEQRLGTTCQATYDESELCKLLLEISLLDSAYQRSGKTPDDGLMDAAKRYRLDTEKLQKAGIVPKFAIELSRDALKDGRDNNSRRPSRS
jgi:hypothetical protein